LFTISRTSSIALYSGFWGLALAGRHKIAEAGRERRNASSRIRPSASYVLGSETELFRGRVEVLYDRQLPLDRLVAEVKYSPALASNRSAQNTIRTGLSWALCRRRNDELVGDPGIERVSAEASDAIYVRAGERDIAAVVHGRWQSTFTRDPFRSFHESICRNLQPSFREPTFRDWLENS
jgi:hypothetical protein